MSKGKINDEVKLLLDRANSADSDEEAESLALKVLEMDPSNGEAKLVLADIAITNGDMETNRYYLDQIIKSCEEKSIRCQRDDQNEDLYISALERMAFSLSFDDQYEEALSVAQKLLEIDVDEKTTAKDMIYRSLLMLNRHRDVLELICSERTHSPVALHAKAIALYVLDGISWNSYEALIDAIESDPDAPFYALGIWEEPEEPDESETDSLLTALYVVEPWLQSDDLMNWLSHVVIIFGFLTERLSEEFMDVLTSGEDGDLIREKLETTRARIDKMMSMGIIEDQDALNMDRIVFDALRFR